jgi:hypothetical protein
MKNKNLPSVPEPRMVRTWTYGDLHRWRKQLRKMEGLLADLEMMVTDQEFRLARLEFSLGVAEHLNPNEAMKTKFRLNQPGVHGEYPPTFRPETTD